MTAPAKPELTADDVRLLQLLADGLAHKEISRRIGCEERTTRKRAARLYARLGVRNAPHAVAYTIRAGLLK